MFNGMIHVQWSFREFARVLGTSHLLPAGGGGGGYIQGGSEFFCVMYWGGR